jgi:P-type Ca2+ transporter type 2C
VTPSITSTPLPASGTDWHTLETNNSLELLQSQTESGLSTSDATQRLQVYGTNELQETAGRSSWQILLDQFTNIMLVMLIAVAFISGGLDLYKWQTGALKAGEIPFKDTIAILAIVILNGVLGYLQESRAEKALAALKRMASPKVRVLRDGKQMDVAAKDIVPGDIILLEAGVQVAADGRLLEEFSLQIRESALTGEAHAVNKQANTTLAPDTPLGDRVNMVFQGTEVVLGKGKVLVTGTGMQTELGRIAAMLQAVESEPTPLQQRMTQLGNTLVTGSLVLVVLTIAIGLIQAGWNWDVFIQLVEVSLSMAVAVVPEGLPAVITVTLALGTQRMVRRNALIRRLPAVETLGSVTNICSDKTGTLTQNKMVVQSVDTLARHYSITGEGYEPTGEFIDAGEKIDPQSDSQLRTLMFACILCNDAILQHETGQWQILGDPTEGALIVLAGKGGLDSSSLTKQFPRVAEFPFSSERKRMSVICQQEDNDGATNSYVLFAKGSPEIVLERCGEIHLDAGLEQLTPESRAEILERNNQMAERGLRVLGLAWKEVKNLRSKI